MKATPGSIISKQEYIDKRFPELCHRYTHRQRDLEKDLRKTAELEYKYKVKFDYPVGHMIIVKLIENKEIEKKTTGGIILPPKDGEIAGSRFVTFSAIVVAMGRSCFIGNMFKDSGIWCEVGDAILFQRHHGVQYNVNTEVLNFDGKTEKVNHVFNCCEDKTVLQILNEETFITRD
jgi:co-chaperonin GroES (HSP10)